MAAPREGLGAGLMALAALSNAVQLALLKYANVQQQLPAMQLALIRVLGQVFLIVIPAMAWLRIPALPTNKHIWWYVLGRGVSGACAMLLSVVTAVTLPLGDSQVLQDMYPIATALLACLCLGETLLRSMPAAILIVTIGAVLITQPPALFDDGGETSIRNAETCPWTVLGVCSYDWGCMTGISTSITMAIAFIMVRKAKDAHPLQLVFCLNVFQALGAIWMAWISGQSFVVPSPQGCILILAMSAANLMYILASTFGSQLLPASLSSILMSTDIVWAYALQTVIFDQHSNITTMVGVVCVAIAIVLLGIEKCPSTVPESSGSQALLKEDAANDGIRKGSNSSMAMGA